MNCHLAVHMGVFAYHMSVMMHWLWLDRGLELYNLQGQKAFVGGENMMIRTALYREIFIPSTSTNIRNHF